MKDLIVLEVFMLVICFVFLLWKCYLEKLGIKFIVVVGYSLGELIVF